MRQLSKGGLRSYLYKQVADGLTTRDVVISIDWKALVDPLEPEKPTPQAIAFESEADILGYGGAAGGGKTDLAIGKAIKRHFKALILRREFNQLKGAIERAKEIIGRAGRYNSTEKLYRLPGGKRIEFGGIEHEGDEEAWQGRDHDLKVFDEATHFTEKVVRYVMTWNRTTRRGQLCQTLLTFNPPTSPKGAWVVTWFAPWLKKNHPNPALPGELRYFVSVENKDREITPAFEVEIPESCGCEPNETVRGQLPPMPGFIRVDIDKVPSSAVVETSLFKRPRVIYEGVVYVAMPKAMPFEVKGETEHIFPISRTFIPATTTDNHTLSPQYLASLDQLPEPLRSMFKYGRFDALTEDEPYQVFPSAWIQAAFDRWTEKHGNERGRLDAIGADIARGGLSQTIIVKRHGNWVDRIVALEGSKTPDGPTAAAAIYSELEGDADILVDVGGPGGSPYDSLKVMAENPGFRGKVAPINFAEKCDMRDRSGRLGMVNMRAGMHWNLRQMLDPEFGDQIALPPDEDLRLDLLAVKWKLTIRGVQIVDKETLTKETGRGFHHSDALILACWLTFKAEVSDDKALLSMLSPSSL